MLAPTDETGRHRQARAHFGVEAAPQHPKSAVPPGVATKAGVSVVPVVPVQVGSMVTPFGASFGLQPRQESRSARLSPGHNLSQPSLTGDGDLDIFCYKT